MINGGYSSALPSSHTFQAGVGQQFCPCFSAGFDLVTPTGHKYLLTLPGMGNRWILGTSHNTMLGPFKPGDTRSINITTVPEPGTWALIVTGVAMILFRVPNMGISTRKSGYSQIGS